MSFPRYERYKDSGVEWLGQVPERWNLERNRVLFKIKKRIAGQLGLDVLSITQQGIRVKDVDSNEGQLSLDYSKYQIVEPDDFAMNHMDLLTGFVDLSLLHGVTSPDYRVFSVRPNACCDKRYFLYLFQNAYKRSIFYAFGQGSSHYGRWRLPTDQFNNFRIPVPPQAEQRSIALFLDHETAKIDALIQEQQRLIELLKEKRQAVISHVVTKGLNPTVPMKESGLDSAGKIPEHWTVARLKVDLSFLTSGSRGWAEHYSDNGDIFLRIGNLNREDIELNLSDLHRVAVPVGAEGERTLVQPGDLLFSITAYLGSVAVVPENLPRSFVSQHLALVRLRRTAVIPQWVAFIAISVIGKTYFEMQGYGGTKIQLSLDEIRNLPVVVPPINEQREIVSWFGRRLHQFAELENEANLSINVLQERRSALISAAVTGKIDVRNYAPRDASVPEQLYASA